MKKKRLTEEQIVGILRDAETSTIEKAARQHMAARSICVVTTGLNSSPTP